MRRLPLLLLSGLLLVLTLPSAASAKLRIGISESQPSMFQSPQFAQTGVKNTRVVVSWNVLARATQGDDEINRVTEYLETARRLGVEALVTFEHARGAAEECRLNRSLPQCYLPTVAEYKASFLAFRARFPWVHTYSPWNEVNHHTQPTSKNPKRAAKFTNVAAKNCRGCTIVVADILDQADKVTAKKPKFKSTTRYIKKFKKALRVKRKLCGIHNYSDTNRFRKAGTKALAKALKCKKLWLTETGGIAKFASFKFSTKRQLKATKYMFKLARSMKKVKRIYVFTFFGGATPRFDAGLVDTAKAGAPRPAFREVVKQIKGVPGVAPKPVAPKVKGKRKR
ncbi:MAG TPA: hypothetical protein VF533_10000 [Solirubrobacteraceae bacterium]|jgi:hypothetical protein